jgi:hypothetical protein
MGVPESTEEQKFLEQQYTALRTEIEQASGELLSIFCCLAALSFAVLQRLQARD